MAKHETIETPQLTEEQQLKIDASIRREEEIALGMYDGRLRENTFVDRRKEQNRRKCRGKVVIP